MIELSNRDKDGRILYKCPYCLFRFYSKPDLIEHLKKSHLLTESDVALIFEKIEAEIELNKKNARAQHSWARLYLTTR